MRALELSDQRFGHISVLRRSMSRCGTIWWTCRCDCGRLLDIRGPSLVRGNTKSCGCRRMEAARRARTTHGHTRQGNYNRAYVSWLHAKDRCTNPRSVQFRYYGGRGIQMCQQWLTSYETFLADMGPRPEGHSLDRIDADGPYAPGNCRWATRQQQRDNWSSHARNRSVNQTKGIS